jgi:ribosomal protein L11 methyltransferase
MPNTNYIEYCFKIKPLQPAADILMAELGEAGFESFVENDEGVQAYIKKRDWVPGILEGIHIMGNPKFKISFDLREIEQENWNATWESNFNPIRIGNDLVVRAPFHEKPKVAYDIVIEPKMSFGTGHHETTHMMLEYILEHEFKGKSVLDMGSGTGVLAILAAMKGAKEIDAIDNDSWCYLNAKENVERNDCNHIQVYEGDASRLRTRIYDIILANINRNILLEDIPTYVRFLKKDGLLFLSGFYEGDLQMITTTCEELGLKFEKNLEKNNWVAAKYVF